MMKRCIYLLGFVACIFGLSARRHFYNESGIVFLQKYGRVYSLTDFFFEKQKACLRYPKNTSNKTINANYKTRKQAQNKYYGTGMSIHKYFLRIIANNCHTFVILMCRGNRRLSH